MAVSVSEPKSHFKKSALCQRSLMLPQPESELAVLGTWLVPAARKACVWKCLWLVPCLKDWAMESLFSSFGSQLLHHIILKPQTLFSLWFKAILHSSHLSGVCGPGPALSCSVSICQGYLVILRFYSQPSTGIHSRGKWLRSSQLWEPLSVTPPQTAEPWRDFPPQLCVTGDWKWPMW